MNILRLLCNEELTTKTTHCLWENLHKVQLIKSNAHVSFFATTKSFSSKKLTFYRVWPKIPAKCKMTTKATVLSPAHQSETNNLMQIYVAQFNQLPGDFSARIQTTDHRKKPFAPMMRFNRTISKENFAGSNRF